MGMTNVILMLPFVRTIEEAHNVIALMAAHDLVRGVNGLQLYMMCEIPSNVLCIDSFAPLFDGFSIGSNDLTQLTLGIDRDSALVAHIFNEQDPAVLQLLGMAIQGAKRHNKKIGICGQGPSDYPALAKFLINEGIDSLSLNPDSVINTIIQLGSE
jgi:pyruvate,water dikinase